MAYQIKSATLSPEDLEWLAKQLVVRLAAREPGELSRVPQHYEACVKALDKLYLSIPQFGAKAR